jgi:SAM-dependent methyltransferase
LAKLGAAVTTTDVSQGQLDLNRQHVIEAGLQERVVSWELADVTDLRPIEDASFDVVVCYGGPLSYALDRADEGVHELLRVVKPDGHVLISVMSNLGSLRTFLEGLADEWESYGPDRWQALFHSGDLAQDQSRTGPMHMFRWSELSAMFDRHGAKIITASAANFVSAGRDEVVEYWLADPTRWETFLAWELEASAEPGALDGGTHIIAVIQPGHEIGSDGVTSS